MFCASSTWFNRCDGLSASHLQSVETPAGHYYTCRRFRQWLLFWRGKKTVIKRQLMSQTASIDKEPPCWWALSLAGKRRCWVGRLGKWRDSPEEAVRRPEGRKVSHLLEAQDGCGAAAWSVETSGRWVWSGEWRQWKCSVGGAATQLCKKSNKSVWIWMFLSDFHLFSRQLLTAIQQHT